MLSSGCPVPNQATALVLVTHPLIIRDSSPLAPGEEKFPHYGTVMRLHPETQTRARMELPQLSFQPQHDGLQSQVAVRHVVGTPNSQE